MVHKLQSKTVEQKFWDRVNKCGKDECWNWKAGGAYGYGYFWQNFKLGFIRAHRYSWILHNGDIPEGLFVCHKCDNPSCVNPNHLFLGDHLDNMADSVKKGRQGKFMLSEVVEIRKKYSSGKYTQEQLSKEFNVSKPAISAITRMISYRV